MASPTDEQVQDLLAKWDNDQRSHKNMNEWIWNWVADPANFVWVTETNNVLVGEAQIRPHLDARAASNPTFGQQELEHRKILLDFYGPGFHVGSDVTPVWREKGLDGGAAKKYRVRTVGNLNNDLKITMFVAAAADKETQEMFDHLIFKTEEAAGTPKGGFPEAVANFKRAQLAVGGGWDTMMQDVADDAVFISSVRKNVIRSKESLGYVLKLYYGFGYKGFKTVGPIHTPARNQAWALVDQNWDRNLPTKDPIAPSVEWFEFDEDGKVKVAAVIVNDLSGADWIGPEFTKFLATVTAGTQEAA